MLPAEKSVRPMTNVWQPIFENPLTILRREHAAPSITVTRSRWIGVTIAARVSSPASCACMTFNPPGLFGFRMVRLWMTALALTPSLERLGAYIGREETLKRFTKPRQVRGFLLLSNVRHWPFSAIERIVFQAI
jgi:hypothetical protein